MSNITSSAYPVVTVTKAGDQFAIVQGGQLKKLTRQGLADFISSLAPNTVLQLTDTPGSYVGQQGKVLVVNPTEDGMVFEAATSGNFLALSDTPANYTGNAGKVASVNTGETALEFIENSFLSNDDTPSTYAGSAGDVLKVNPTEDGVEFAAPVSVEGNFFGGFFDYSHGGANQSYTGGSGPLKLLNDEAGPFTLKTYAPVGITDVWDSTANSFDFSELQLADMIDIRLDLSITTTGANQEVTIYIQLGEGSGSPYTINLANNQFKTSGTYQVTRYIGLYIGNAITRDNPASVYFESASNATIDVGGWYVKVTERGIE